MARLKIELSNEDLETLKRGAFIEVESIGNTPKIVISAEPEFDFNSNKNIPKYKLGEINNEMLKNFCIPSPLDITINSVVDEEIRRRRLSEWQKGWSRDQ